MFDILYYGCKNDLLCGGTLLVTKKQNEKFFDTNEGKKRQETKQTKDNYCKKQNMFASSPKWDNICALLSNKRSMYLRLHIRENVRPSLQHNHTMFYTWKDSSDEDRIFGTVFGAKWTVFPG